MSKPRWQGVIGICALAALIVPALTACAPRETPLPGPATRPASTPTPTRAAPTATFLPATAAAPTAEPTAEAARGSACLMGEWRLEDAEAYFEEALRASASPAEFKGAEGSLTYLFSSDGVLKISFDEFSVSLNAAVDGGTMVTRSTLDGSAAANYRALDDEELALSSFSGDGVLLVIEVDGQILVQTALPAWASFFAALSQTSAETAPAAEPPAEVRATFNCSGTRLSLRGSGLPVEMNLVRGQ